ncbi:MAG: hypothetical protein ACKVW3_04625 [Phycisphaerales bacterium]
MKTTTQITVRAIILGAALAATTPTFGQVTLKPVVAHNEQGRRIIGTHKAPRLASQAGGLSNALPGGGPGGGAPIVLIEPEPSLATMPDPRLLDAWLTPVNLHQPHATLDRHGPGNSRALTGGSAGTVPTPGALALVAMALGLATRRSRRSATTATREESRGGEE